MRLQFGQKLRRKGPSQALPTSEKTALRSKADVQYAESENAEKIPKIAM
jgi:hypothetical protein